jgi:hypothetical protein
METKSNPMDFDKNECPTITHKQFDYCLLSFEIFLRQLLSQSDDIDSMSYNLDLNVDFIYVFTYNTNLIFVSHYLVTNFLKSEHTQGLLKRIHDLSLKVSSKIEGIAAINPINEETAENIEYTFEILNDFRENLVLTGIIPANNGYYTKVD